MASGPRPEPKKKSPASRSNRDLQRRLDALLEKSPRAIAILDADGRIEDINPAFEALWFRRRADVEGHILREVLPPGADAIIAELESAVRHRRALGGR
jgi:PAS domain S-box-containing protein